MDLLGMVGFCFCIIYFVMVLSYPLGKIEMTTSKVAINNGFQQTGDESVQESEEETLLRMEVWCVYSVLLPMKRRLWDPIISAVIKKVVQFTKVACYEGIPEILIRNTN